MDTPTGRTPPLLRPAEQVTLLVVAVVAGALVGLSALGDGPRRGGPDEGLQLRLDPNRADKYALMHLPGVGEATAERIIAGRPYRTVEQLREVKYIGPSRLARLRPHVMVEPPIRNDAR